MDKGACRIDQRWMQKWSKVYAEAFKSACELEKSEHRIVQQCMQNCSKVDAIAVNNVCNSARREMLKP